MVRSHLHVFSLSLLIAYSLSAAGTVTTSEDRVVSVLRAFVSDLPRAEITVSLDGGAMISYRDGKFFVRRGGRQDTVTHSGLATFSTAEPETADHIVLNDKLQHALLQDIARLFAMSGGRHAAIRMPGRPENGAHDLIIEATRRKNSHAVKLMVGRERRRLLRRYLFDFGDNKTGPIFRIGKKFDLPEHHEFAQIDKVRTIYKDATDKMVRITITNLLRDTPFSGFEQLKWTPYGVYRGVTPVTEQDAPKWKKIMTAKQARTGQPSITAEKDRIQALDFDKKIAAQQKGALYKWAPNVAVIEAMKKVVALFDPLAGEQLHVGNRTEGLHPGTKGLVRHYRAYLTHADDGTPVMELHFLQGQQNIRLEFPLPRPIVSSTRQSVPMPLTQSALETARVDALANLMQVLGPWGELDVVANRTRRGGAKPYMTFSGKFTAPDRIKIFIGNREAHEMNAENAEPSTLKTAEYGTHPLYPLLGSTEHTVPSFLLPHEILVQRTLSASGEPAKWDQSWAGTRIQLKRRAHSGHLSHHGMLGIGKKELWYSLQSGKEIKIALSRLTQAERQALWDAVTALRTGSFRKGTNELRRLERELDAKRRKRSSSHKKSGASRR